MNDKVKIYAIAVLGTVAIWSTALLAVQVHRRPAIDPKSVITTGTVMLDNQQILDPQRDRDQDILRMAQAYMKLAVSVQTDKAAAQFFDLEDQLKHLKADNASLLYENAQLRHQLPQAILVPYHGR